MPQIGEPTYAAKLGRDDLALDPDGPVAVQHARVRALAATTGARLGVGGRAVSVWRLAPRTRGSAARSRHARVSTIAACCSGAPTASLELVEMQPAGRRRMEATRVGSGHPRRASRCGAPVSDAARRVAYAVVRRSLDSGAYADRAIDGEATRAGLDARDRAFASFLALGTVQHLRTLDAAIEHAAERSPDRLERPLLHALRLGAFQLLFAGSVPDRAAVSETVELVRTVVGPRATGLANAVLRRVASDGPALARLAARGHRRGGRAPALAARLGVPSSGSTRTAASVRWSCAAPRTSRRARCSARTRCAPRRARSSSCSTAAGVEFETDAATGALVVAGPFDLAGSELYERGLVVAQSLSSIAVVDLVARRAGRARARSLRGTRRQDRRARRQRARTSPPSRATRPAPRRSRTTLTRLGVGDVEVVEADGRAYEGERFDAILVDAPCSGLGVLNGRPDSRWRRSPSDVEALAVLQTELVAHARELLVPGGRLVYAACTLSPDENERVPRAAGLTPVSERRLWPGPGADGFYVATLRPPAVRPHKLPA